MVADVAPQVVIASNRGPLSFSYDEEGALRAKRGAGGLVSSLGPLVEDTGATWVAAAISAADREVAARGVVEAEGFRLRSLVFDEAVYRMAYDVVSNGTLWFLHHSLYDLPRRPRIDRHWKEAWAAYRAYNRAFAGAIGDEAPEGATVHVQDYHLALVGTWLAQERADLRTVHFTHTPFCGPNSIRVLPTTAAEELLAGMASHTSCGFHTERWARAFRACCEDVLGVRPATFVSPVAADAADLESVASSPACEAEHAWLDDVVGDRRLILRTDRIELSKNLLRGFHAFDELLRSRPEWRGRVVFVALVYPSRQGLAEYLAYQQEVETLVRQLNARWSTPGWTPVVLDPADNFPRTVAALQRYDVLLVNPIRDGLNLVAKEGAILNRTDGVVALSRDAGSWDELGELAVEVNPFDVAGTADALAEALTMDPGERRDRAIALRKAAASRTPRDWLADQLAAARGQ
jgi:trehalose 6-phosphate synthase